MPKHTTNNTSWNIKSKNSSVLLFLLAKYFNSFMSCSFIYHSVQIFPARGQLPATERKALRQNFCSLRNRTFSQLSGIQCTSMSSRGGHSNVFPWLAHFHPLGLFCCMTKPYRVNPVILPLSVVLICISSSADMSNTDQEFSCTEAMSCPVAVNTAAIMLLTPRLRPQEPDLCPANWSAWKALANLLESIWYAKKLKKKKQ